MATLRNKRKLAAVTEETQEEHPRNGQSRNTSAPRINEECITQVSEEVEGRVTKKLSQEFSRTESRILGALSKLNEFLLNPQITTHSETVPGTFRNTNVENQGTNEDDSQSDPHPEAGIFRGQTTQNFGAKDCRDMVTGVQGGIRYRPTWWQEVQKRFAMAMTWWQQFKKMFPTAPLDFPQENKRMRAPQVSHNFAARTPLRQLKQIRFCWPFSSWRRTVILPMLITTVTKFQNCLSLSRQQCPPSTGNQRNSNCLKIYSKRV